MRPAVGLPRRLRRPRRALACRDVVELLTDYLERALRRGDRLRIERHLARCRGCVAYLGQLRTVIELLGRLGSRTKEDD